MLGLTVGLLLTTAGCLIQPNNHSSPPTLFVGIDASKSFKASEHYEESLAFLAHYIYGHLNELGGLRKPQALFVGSVDGTSANQPKSFHLIQEFEGKTAKAIESDLRAWFRNQDTLTDFNSYFKEVAHKTEDQQLTLSPITVMIVSDGLPGFSEGTGPKKTQDRQYQRIDLQPLEHLSRNITLRLAYVTPPIGQLWQTQVSRQRVRLWTGNIKKMTQWPNYLRKDLTLSKQERFWTWLKKTVDFPVRIRRV